jgi:hypothetical protein
MATALKLERELQVSFSVNDVKKSIDNVCEFKKTKYQLKEKNDVLNSYSIVLFDGFSIIIPLNIQLKKVSDNETEIKIVSDKATNQAYGAGQLLDKFLATLSKSLSGETLVEEQKKGCLSSFIGIVAIGGSLVYYLFN